MRKQPRRWASRATSAKAAPMTEHGITPNEAKAAVEAMLIQVGLELLEVLDYDYRKDKFLVLARRAKTMLVEECALPGESVAQLVRAVRVLSGKKVLRHKSEKVPA